MIQSIEDLDSGSISPPLPRRTRFSKRVSKKSTIETLELSSSSILTPKECRICLEGESDGQLIAPCNCTGSVRWVHDTCYRQWIERQYANGGRKQQIKILEKGVECQLCKRKISLRFTHRYRCCQKGKFSTKYRANPGVFFMFLVFLVMNLGCIGYLSYHVATNPLNFTKEIVISAVTICAFLFFILTSLLTFYYFIMDYALDRTWILDSFQKNPVPSSGSHHRIHPESAIENLQ